MKRTCPWILFVLISCLSGCSSTPADPGKSNASTSAPVKRTKLQILDSQLANVLYIDGIEARRTSNKLLAVHASFKNPLAQPLHFQSQTLYYDANGNLLFFDSEADASWTSINIPPQTEFAYRSQSLSPMAESYVIRLRSAP